MESGGGFGCQRPLGISQLGLGVSIEVWEYFLSDIGDFYSLC